MTRSQVGRRAFGGPIGAVGFAAVLVAGASWAQGTPAVPKQLRLADAVKIALAGSTQIGTQDAQLDAARKARSSALFALGPDLQLSAQKAKNTRTDFDAVTNPDGSKSNATEKSDYVNGDISASVRLFDGFANLARLSAAKHDVHANEQSLAYTRKQVQESVVAAYYNLLRAKLLLKVAEEGESVAREQLQRTQALYELGSAARSDVLKSQVQHGNTRLVLVRARNSVRQTHVDLEFSMNLTSSNDFDIDTTITIGTSPQTVDYAAEREFAIGHRENLFAARSHALASARRVQASRGALLPTLDFRYTASRTNSNSQFQFGANKNWNRQWALSANWNLWDRYQVYANIAQARAAARGAEFSRRQAELDASREVQQLVNAIDESQERLGVARENVERSREDLRLAQEKFRVGAGTILDTITAESDLTLTRASEVQAMGDYLIARANLSRATGRDFTDL